MLPHARLRFQAVVDTPLRLPDYAGSTLRGAFGGGRFGRVRATGASDPAYGAYTDNI